LIETKTYGSFIAPLIRNGIKAQDMAILTDFIHKCISNVTTDTFYLLQDGGNDGKGIWNRKVHQSYSDCFYNINDIFVFHFSVEANIMKREILSKKEDEKYSEYGKWIVIGGTLYIVLVLFLVIWRMIL